MELQFCLNIDSTSAMATFVSIPIQRVGTSDFVKTSSERQIPIEVESDIAGSQVEQSLRGRSVDINYETIGRTDHSSTSSRRTEHSSTTCERIDHGSTASERTDNSSTSSRRPAIMERKPPPGKPPRTAPMPRFAGTLKAI